MGVKRAVDLAIDESRKARRPIYTLGPLIHNIQTLELLTSKGVYDIKECDPPPEHAHILVRAHGVTPETEENYREQGYTLIDGTCPKVKTVHRVIEKYREKGYYIVIIGDRGHAEVEGLLGYAGGEGTVISQESDIESLPEKDKICVVSQTTFNSSEFDSLTDTLRQRLPAAEFVIKKTICAATNKRQAEIRNLATQVDALVVVGGKHSANTTRLAHIGCKAGLPTQHVETEKELDTEALSRYSTVGVTAGASTPNWMIKRVAATIGALDTQSRNYINRFTLKALHLLGYCNIFMAFSAVCASFFSCVVQDIFFFQPRILLSTAAIFLYFFSMHLWNSVANSEITQHLGVARYTFYSRHKRLLLSCAGLGMGLLLLLSSIPNRAVFFLMLFSTVIGLAYHLPVVPAFLRRIIPYRSIKDVPTSKDLFVALAWGAIITFIFQAGADFFFRFDIYAASVFLILFFYSYIRSLLMDLRDIEGDRIMGRETLITLIGEKRALSVIYVMLFFIILVCCLPGLFSLLHHGNLRSTDYILLLQLPGVAFIKLIIDRKAYRTIDDPSIFNLLCNAQFFIVGILALTGYMVLQSIA